MRIGVLTGGGDVPGLNPCLQALALAAAEQGWEVIGFRQGWLGPLSIAPDYPLEDVADWTIALTPERVRGIDRQGGTLLHTSRTDPRRRPEGDRTAHVLAVLDALGIDCMVTLGGDGTLRFSAHLAAQGFPVLSIPKTMDNDVFGTDYCIGFSTAVSRSVEAINALRTTTASHERIGVVELFGRRSGETALLAGYLARADRTVIAEVGADAATFLPLIEGDWRASPERYAMVVVSEGAVIGGDTSARNALSQAATHRDDIGSGLRLARLIEAQTGIGTVVQELAYLMRAGAPDALDRLVGSAFGTMAVQLLREGVRDRMLAIRDGNYTHVPIDTLLGGTRQVDVDGLYDRAAFRARIVRVDGLPMFLT